MTFKEYKNVKPAMLVKGFLDLITDGVFEVRIPKTRVGTISGYFNDTAIAAALIAKENGKHPAIYVTANPVQPSLLARNHNRLEFGSMTTTTDAEIIRRRWFLVDLDPRRPAGISSTDAELEQAITRAEEISGWLATLGWPEPVMGMSGNGAHLMYRVDEENSEEVRINIEFATKMLAAIWNDDHIEVDTSVWNASRIWKVAGTIAAKGSDAPDRPHRVARLVKVPQELQVVPMGLVESLAQAMKNSKADEFKDMTGEYIADMQKWLTDRGLTVTAGPKPLYGTEGKKWVISRCPFNHNHVGPIVGVINNRPIYRCLHNSCSAYRWKEFREKVDPNFKDPDTIYARLKEWCEGSAEECDQELLESACRTGKKLPGIIKQLKKDCVRSRVLILEDLLKQKHREFIKQTLGDNQEKGNIVGLIVRTKKMQEEGLVPMFWVADYDYRIRVGTVGDVGCERANQEHEIALMVKFHSMGDSWVRQGHCAQVIVHLAQEYKINPLKTYLKQFRWDGTKRLDTWLIDYLGTKDTAYTRAVGRKWFISAAARGMDPGCQADHMLILEGAQGIGKSQALRAIGGNFYVEYSKGIGAANINGHRDLVHVILGKQIVEMAELATIRKADMETLKATLTTTVDEVRLSYERDARAYPRTCVFAGTTNEVGSPYIADVSGARRFWPVVAGESQPLKISALKEVRDQLWAEAVEAYESGEDWWTIPAEEAAHEQADRQIHVEMSDPWYMMIRQALTDPHAYESGAFEVRPHYVKGQKQPGSISIRAGAIHMVLGMIIGVEVERQSPADAARIKNIFRAIGFKKVRPEGGWFSSTYAYDLHRDAAPHLWPAIVEAVKSGARSKFDAAIEM